MKEQIDIDKKAKEAMVVRMLSEGKKAAEIARTMELSTRTAEAYIDRIRAIYGAKNTPHLVAIFYQRKILS